jgi:putrescine aminotransferase
MKRSTAEWRALDQAHFLHPFTDHKDLHSVGSRIIERGEGIYIFDSDGHRYLDAMSGLWCVNVGYGRQELITAAHRQLQRLPFYNSFFKCTHPPAIELATKLAEITPAGLNHVFFTNSGSEANDSVIRLVRHFWATQGKPDKKILISRREAYHGSTMGGASLGGQSFIHAQGGLPIPGIEHIDMPYYFGYSGPLNEQEFGIQSARLLETTIEELGADRVAAFIAEPVQGAGGVIIPPDSYWPEIQRICRKREILLVVDEVICGFGRTGRWFGSDYYDLQPDLMPMAKGISSGYLPLGAVMVHDRVAEVLVERGGELAHGFTYSGHPVSCAVANANIELIQRDGLVDEVRLETAPYFRERWLQLGQHPLVGEARCLGLLAALELVSDKSTRERFETDPGAGIVCRDLALENGLVMRAVRDTMIAAPPLITSKQQIDELVELARKTLDQTAERLALLRAEK